MAAEEKSVERIAVAELDGYPEIRYSIFSLQFYGGER